MESKNVSEFPFPKLLESCTAALCRSYCPYSNFSVAASLLCEDGSIFTGVNVENASYGLTMCAERTAIGAAVSQGHLKFKAIAIVTGSSMDEFLGPCGACRQVLAEFGVDWEVYLIKKDGQFVRSTVGELLPHAFIPQHLKR